MNFLRAKTGEYCLDALTTRTNRAGIALTLGLATALLAACSAHTRAENFAGASGAPPANLPGVLTATSPSAQQSEPLVSLESDSETLANTVEDNLNARHLIFDLLMDPIDPPGGTSVGAPDDQLFFVNTADSAIWTGHYLAAAAFHYAAEPSAAQLARVKAALSGLQRLVYVSPNQDVLVRVAIPASDPRVQGSCSFSVYPDAASCKAGGGTWNPVGPMLNLTDAQNYGAYIGTAEDGLNYVYFGRTSRDQYAGAFLGLAVAYDMVDDPGVRATCVDLVTRLTNGLNSRSWTWTLGGTPPTTLVVPTDNSEITWNTNKIHIAGILQVAKHLNPAAFTTMFNNNRPGFIADLELDIEALDNYSGYFKFNLDFIHFYNLVRLETNFADHQNYWKQYGTLRSATVGANSGFDNNALFNMYDLVINGGAPWGQCEVQATCPDANRESASADMLNRYWPRSTRNIWVDNRGNPAIPTCNPPLGLLSSLLGDVGLSGLFSSNGKIACGSIPVELRVSDEFLWQVSPQQLDGGGAGNVELSGVDYLLPFWMGRYYQVFAGPPPPPPLVSIAAAGTGCADGFCLWITGSGFSADTSVQVEDGSGNVLGTYSGAALVVTLNASPQVITLRLASELEQTTLVNQGLTVVVTNPDLSASATSTIAAPPLQSPTATATAGSPAYVTLSGIGIAPGALIALADGNHNLVTPALAASLLDYSPGTATTPATLEFGISGGASAAALASGTASVAVQAPGASVWQYVPVAAP